MSTLAQIVLATVWLIIVVEVTVLIVSVIYMHRKRREESDTAADERAALMRGQGTLGDRIERLRKENAERPTQTVMLFNSKRHAVLATWKAHLDKDGLPVPSEPSNLTRLKENRGAEVLVIVVETGEGSFLEALRT